MHDCHIEASVGSWLTVFAKDLDEVLAILLLHKEFTHAKGISLGLHVESLLAGKLLVGLLSDVEHFALQGNADVSEIGGHLEVQNTVPMICKFEALKGLGDWDRIDIGCGGQCDLAVLDQLKGSKAVVDLELGLNQELGFVANQDTLRVEMDPGIEGVGLSLSLEVAKLGESIVHENGLGVSGALPVRDEDLPALVGSRRVVLPIKLDASTALTLISEAYFLVLVKNISQMPGDRGLMNH